MVTAGPPVSERMSGRRFRPGAAEPSQRLACLASGAYVGRRVWEGGLCGDRNEGGEQRGLMGSTEGR